MSLERKQFALGNLSLDLFIYTDKEQTPWFKAKEVAVFLGYKDADKAIRTHVFNCNKISWIGLPPFQRVSEKPVYWKPNTVFIKEPGLYQLMMKSKLPNMEAFQQWVTSDHQSVKLVSIKFLTLV